ncbi:MAG: dNTP triphosphohydrolase [Phycisphaerae bacterium]
MPSPLDLTREHADPYGAELPPLVLDRQRIVHSAAFRRLQYKTQVFVAPEGDHHRSRLTHTLEVAHLARCLAARLRLNEDLAEVVSLAHDLGHPPFGHAGEVALAECMRGHGGFEHNAHALRLVEELEHPYPEFRGLNLTRAVRECLAKHSTIYDRPGPHPLQDGNPPPAEGHVAALADSLTYTLHDLQDGLYAGLVDPAELAPLNLCQAAGFRGETGDTEGWRRRLRPAMDRIQEMLIADIAAGWSTNADERASGPPPSLSPPMQAQLDELSRLLRERVYRSPRIRRMDAKARRILKAVFDAYVAAPSELPARFAERVALLGAHRVAADFVAGMTDRYCLREHARLFDPRAE